MNAHGVIADENQQLRIETLRAEYDAVVESARKSEVRCFCKWDCFFISCGWQERRNLLEQTLAEERAHRTAAQAEAEAERAHAARLRTSLEGCLATETDTPTHRHTDTPTHRHYGAAVRNVAPCFRPTR